MGQILQYIAKQTEGQTFKSFKYCYDNISTPHIDYDEAEKSYVNLKDYAEDNHNPNSRDLTELAKRTLACPPLFKFFLDGSRKVYKVDDIEYSQKVYPVVSGQISVAVCGREMQKDGVTFKSFHHVDEESYSVLCLPVVANSEGVDNAVYFNNLCAKINAQPALINSAIELRNVLWYFTKLEGKETLEQKGIARVQDEMVECEKKIVARMMNKHLLSQDAYLIKDGSIQYKSVKTGDYRELAKIKNNYRHVVGVSKHFNPNLMKDKRERSSAAAIARLPLYHRTPAFLWSPGERVGNVTFAIWYLRLREPEFTDTPYSGVIKVEKILVTNEEIENGLSSDEIDLISANLINERNPVCYGNDARWANHLYPVYMTECYCKSRFQSDYYFLNIF